MRKAYIANVVEERTVIFVVDSSTPKSDYELERLATAYADEDKNVASVDADVRIREISSIDDIDDYEADYLSPDGPEELGSYGVYGKASIELCDLAEWLGND